MADEETKPADAGKEEPKPEAAEAAAPAEEAKAAPAPAEEAKAATEEKPQGGAPREEKRERTAADVLLELEGGEEASKPKILKAKGSKNIHTGIVHIRATFNNTSVTISDQKGNVIGWSTSGKMGFRGSRKSTAYAAQVVSQDACRQAMSHGLKEAEVRVKGPGAGRESAVRAIQNMGVEILAIRDVTPVPHNGCRPPKARRV
ncbi:MAG: 30S ribosomal protein S11 [Verrucomicrobiota bacterium]